MKEIQLTRGFVAIVDDEDFPELSVFSWQSTLRSGKVYAQRKNLCAPGVVLMHRHILGLAVNDGKKADHINRNGLDNRRSNLRVATPSQNGANAIARGGVSAWKGVTIDRRDGVWQAQIMVNHVHRNLGRFRDEDAAARAYDDAAREAFGPFARLNFPRDGELPAVLAVASHERGG